MLRVDDKGKLHHLCLVVYHMPSNFIPTVVSHGNSKSKAPFFPTWPSTMKRIKKEAEKIGPKAVVSEISSKVGGVLEAKAPGQLPRDENQVSNVKRSITCQESKGDELYYMMQQAKVNNSFVQHIKTTPDPAIVLANDRQLDDLVRFCAPSVGIEISILSVDPTFNLGDFEFTPTAYRHLLLTTRRYDKPPLFLGPCLVHYRKNFPSFLFFASSLVALRRDLESLRAFGTDGEKALYDAFLHEFRYAVHLFCSIHARRNVKDELCKRKLPENVACEITDSIFGKKVGSTYVEGLVDATDEACFNQKLEELKSEWEQNEDKNPSCVPGFYEWFCTYKVESILSGMLKPIREEAGLGFPPTNFTTNASESLNAMIKRKVDYKRNELPVFVSQLKEMVDEQERELERALIGRGKYKFRKEFHFLEIPEGDWFRMSKAQRENHMKKVQRVCLNAGTSQVMDEIISISNSQFPVTPEEFHSGLKIPLQSIQGIWKKASELINNPTAISPAPGYGPECKVVMSRHGKRPHLVTKGKGNKFSCDNDCPNWKSLGICSHSVSVAHLNGQMREFCDQHRKHKHLPSITKLVLTGLTGGVGNKGNRVTRKRKHEEVTARAILSVATPKPVTTTPSCTKPPVVHQTSVTSTTAVVHSTVSSSAYCLPGPSSQTTQSTACSSVVPCSTLPAVTNSCVKPPVVPVFLPTSTTAVDIHSTVNSSPGSSSHTAQSSSAVSFPAVTMAGPSQLLGMPTHFSPAVNPNLSMFSPIPTPAFQWNASHMQFQPAPSPSSNFQTFISPPTSFLGGQQTTDVFELCFRSGNIRICNGCRNNFDKQAIPPHDLCIRHKEWRSFTSPVTNQIESRFGNAYYHVNTACILARCTGFSTSSIRVENEVNVRLLKEHKDYICKFLGLFIP